MADAGSGMGRRICSIPEKFQLHSHAGLAVRIRRLPRRLPPRPQHGHQQDRLPRLSKHPRLHPPPPPPRLKEVIWCIDKGGPVFVAVYQPVQTLVVAITSSLLLGEEFYLGGIIGAVMIIFGLYLVVWGKSEEKKKKKFAEIQRRAEHNTPQIRTCITQPLLAQSFDYG
ncbi:hypothetical protein SASPL_116196 [Salvia splendens]|uniref:WAT1-related protein n=1 Tax=Salvia splendens TaxID=180675 RepID=A0A8X8ZV64_SALSN|nr:hypothetical protein SASPL_116196 [Salvia splendens]